MFSAYPPVRRIPGVAGNYPASSRGSAEKARPFRHTAPGPVPGIAEAPRIHPDAEGSRSLSDHHVDRALGQHPHGRLARTTAASPTQKLRAHVRSRDGLFGMQRAAFGEIRACASRSGRAEILTNS